MADIASNLTAHWPFPETTATTAADASGNGHDLSLGGGDTFATAGKKVAGPGALVDAVALDGSADYLQTLANLSLSATHQVTASGWMFYDGTYSDGNDILWELGLNTGGVKKTFNFTPESSLTAGKSHGRYKGNEGICTATTDQPATGQWVHVVVVYDTDSVDDVTAVYFDGVAQTLAFPEHVDNDDNFASTQKFNLGARNGTSLFAPVRIADVRLYSRALSAADVQALYDLAAPQNVVLPDVSGIAKPENTLTCSSGTWVGGGSVTYQWRIAEDAIGTNEQDISGETGNTYDVVEGDIGYYVRMEVTNANAYGTTMANSAYQLITAAGGVANKHQTLLIP